MATLPPASVDCILTDLPYGTTRNAWDSIIPLDQLWSAWKRILKPGGPVILFSQQPFTTTLGASNLKNLRTEWIWKKNIPTGFLNAKVYPLKSHENILVFCDRKPPYFPQMSTGAPYISRRTPDSSSNYGKHRSTATINSGTRYPTTVLDFKSDRGDHPTQKPVALCEYLIRTYTQPGQIVLDCCMGSGTTAVAAINTGRRFIGFETNAEYCLIAHRRIAWARTDRELNRAA